MFARVASRYRSWVDNSLANRFSAAAMALAGTAVLTLSIITYAAIGSLLSDRIYARIEAQSGYVASGFRFQLENLVKSSRDLASRTLVRTALADTEGRRAYLEPFIGEFRDSLPGIWAVEVVDFRGRALIRSGEAPLVDSDRTVAARVADSGTSEALLLRRGTHAHLLLVHPVIYEPTGTSEGAVLVEIDLDGLFHTRFAALEADYRLTLTDASHNPLLLAGRSFAGEGVGVTLPLTDGLATAIPPLFVRAELSALQAHAPLLQVSLLYLLVAAVALIATRSLATATARRLTGPLRDLAATARRIADEGIAAGGAVETRGNDEISAVGRAFNRMLATVQGAQDGLEREVERRTQALAETQARLAGILESIQDVLYSVSTDLRETLYMSPSAYRITNTRSLDPRVDFAWLRSLVVEEDQALVASVFRELLEEGCAELRYRIRCPDNQQRWLFERIYLVFNEQGEPAHIDGIISDVTEQVEAEAAREAAELTLRLKDRALESSRSGILIVAVSQGVEEKVEYANPAFALLTGYTAEETIGRDWRFLHADRRDANAVATLRQAVRQRSECAVTLRLRCRDGARRWCELSISPVREDDGTVVTHMIGVLNDISERIRSERRYQSVVESVKDVIFQADAHKHFTFLNPAWQEITGFATTASAGSPMLDYLLEEDRPRARDRLDEVLDGTRDACTCELRCRTADGGFRWIRLHARAAHDDGGQISGLNGSLSDITERHQAEEDLRIRDRALQASSNGIVISDMTEPGQPIVYANDAFTRITGYEVAEVIGTNCRFLQGQETSQPELDTLREALASESECQVVLRNFRKDGRMFWNELSMAPVRDPQTGRVTHYVGVQTDVTDKRDAEARMFEWFVRLDTIFTLSPDGFVSFDSEGRLAFANPAFERMVGLNVGELEGMSIEAFDACLRERCDPAQPFPALSDCMADCDTCDQRETCARSQDRHVLTLMQPTHRVLSRSIRQAGADAASRVVYFRDITRESEVDRMKSEFLSTAAHELRTPMASIMGFSELLLNRKYDEGRTRDLLETINRQSTRLTQLLNELLDLARIEARAGKDFRIDRIGLDRIVDETLKALMMPGDRRHVTVMRPDPMPEVEVDAAKIQQALTNILSNAYKYSPEGGEITLRILLEGEGAGQRVGLEVTDQGIGMTPEQTARAFERFFRADSSGNIPGTGLGLSLVKEIVELHGGRVALESRSGAGTRITLWLPVASGGDGQTATQTEEANA
ncbi:MAG: PAS domain S-box protein [Rhodocyclaceae bacterium]|nr:PAS domain S-box protein [Rhodocyclaceae bacterium]